MTVGDVDGDGDADVIWSHLTKTISGSSGGEITWYENTDGAGTFVEQEIIAVDDSPMVWLIAEDLDGDGDLDVLEASLLGIAWHENRLAGDVDDNGEVAFADFLELSSNFANVDAVWEDGDLDGNGKVEFADFLILSANFGNKRPTAERVSN